MFVLSTERFVKFVSFVNCFLSSSNHNLNLIIKYKPFLVRSCVEAVLFLSRDWDKEESILEENIMYSFCTYIAENAESLNLVEGEKVHVLGKCRAAAE